MTESSRSHGPPVHRPTPTPWTCVTFLVLLASVTVAQEPALNPNSNRDGRLDFFESRIRPALIQHCYECHSGQAAQNNGNLRLDSQVAMRKGGTRGDVLAGDSHAATLLWKAIQYRDEELQMPPSGKLPETVLDDFRQWIQQGAVDPRTSEPTTTPSGQAVTMQQRTATHWAYQPVRPQPLPELGHADWPRVGLDWFVLSQLEQKGWQPNPEADRRTLIRRLYYDLLGLTPTHAQVQAFEADQEPDAYPRLIDQLLASPRFGERMSRRWMDVARYADTKGYVFQEDRKYPHAFRYRDWLLRSWNSDLPYQDFVRYQLAADRLDPDNAQGHLDAMGMLTLGRRFLNNKNDIADDRIDVVSRGLMGMTLGCARCHDHKFDPLTMKDYYSMQGVFMNSDEPGGDPSPLRLVDKKEVGPVHILLRGQPGNRGDRIEPQFVAFLAKDQPVPLADGSGRVDLARHIADAQNPLTHRVFVNRVWGWIFGLPLVDTPSDFGLRSEAPVHRDLLDHLTVHFQDQGFSTKELVRNLVLSATYRQSSQLSPSVSHDPENRYWSRAVRKRMDFESYRDAMLLAARQMDHAIGGPSEPIHESPYSFRRTVYAYIDRQNLPGLFRAFDFVSPDAHAPIRSLTTIPQQGLFVLNSDMVQDLAEQVARGPTEPVESAIRHQFHQVLYRDPTPDEAAQALTFLDSLEDSWKAVSAPVSPWRYGVGQLSEDGAYLEHFQEFSDFRHGRWAVGKEVPDQKKGWVYLTADGGHPGGHGNAAVRRWMAPHEGAIEVRGELKHASDSGDGVRGAILIDGNRVEDAWLVKKGNQTTKLDRLVVLAGQEVDFVVDCLGSEDSDEFQWSLRIKYIDGPTGRYHSKSDFSGPPPVPLSRMAHLAQVLLGTNEFCFID